MKKWRIEKDWLGEVKVPSEAYWGAQTQRAIQNFPVSGLRADPDFIRAYVMVKKAACIANEKAGKLNKKISRAIQKACDEILSGKLMDQFVVDVFQAGAGTSFNMNVNEVLANRALEILGRKKGDYSIIHPNDHVNASQSTNDTFPTALNLSLLFKTDRLIKNLKTLEKAFRTVGRKLKGKLKPGRTHLMDAMPVEAGEVFNAYAETVKKCIDVFKHSLKFLREVPLGGTAVGTGINAPKVYRKEVVKVLSRISGYSLKPSSHPYEGMQSRNAAYISASALKLLSIELARISTNLRYLSSGPATGFGEFTVYPVQPGSSIMPGKVNPVLAECLNMICFFAAGCEHTVELAVLSGEQEINVMMPVMAFVLHLAFESFINFIPIFAEKFVLKLQFNEKRALQLALSSAAIGTVLSPFIGYHTTAQLIREAAERGESIKALVLERNLLDPEQVERLFSFHNLLGKKS